MTNTLITHAKPWSAGSSLAGDAVWVRDGRIAGIGLEDELRERARAAGGIDRSIDAAGALVHPSFADAHIHAAFGGVEMERCDLTACGSAEEAIATIGAYAARTDAPWILGGGWSMAHFPGGTPTREALDAVVPDRPAMLINADHHGAWVNSRALEIAGVDTQTLDPADGRIERDAAGRPSGTLHEGAAELVAAHTPETTTAEVRAGVHTAVAYLSGLGVTAWQEAIVGPFSGYPDVAAAYARAFADDGLAARVAGALWVPRDVTPEGIPALLADFARRRDENAAAGFPCTTAKLMIDGVAENRTALMAEDYCGHAHRGLSYFTEETVLALVPALNEAGFAVHFHAIGDGAVTLGLDAVAAVPAERRQRNHMAHVQVVAPEDVPRFRELGVTVNAQALWAVNEAQMTELTLPILGPERAAWQYPFGAMRRAGATIAMGSDWPVSTPDPWQAIHVAVNRRAPGDTAAEPLGLEQALTLGDALDAYTRVSHDLIGFGGASGAPPSGVLAEGARADLVIANRDPFAGPTSDIFRTSARIVFLGGEIVSGA